MAESVQITLRVDDAATEGVYAEPLGDALYRLEDSPLLANWEDAPVHAGDVVELEARPDGSHWLVRAVARTVQRHHSWLLPRRFTASPEWPRFTAAVEGAGGTWEQVFGGVVQVHIPAGSPFDAEAELRQRMMAAGVAENEA